MHYDGSKPKSCYYCSKTGHIQRFCEELKKKKKNEDQEREKEPAIANFSHHGAFNETDSDSENECISK